MERTLALVGIVVLLGLGSPPVAADPLPQWSRPVDGPVVRGYEPPARPFGPRHLGLDFAAPPGTPVRAAGDGVVVFAGRVGGQALAVALQHPAARRTTYAYLLRLTVVVGTPVRRGTVLGESGGTGPGHGADVVHFGYRVAGVAQDPAPLFAPGPARISLAPLDRPACAFFGPAVVGGRRGGGLGGWRGGPATLGTDLTAPGRESARPHSNGVRR